MTLTKSYLEEALREGIVCVADEAAASPRSGGGSGSGSAGAGSCCCCIGSGAGIGMVTIDGFGEWRGDETRKMNHQSTRARETHAVAEDGGMRLLLLVLPDGGTRQLALWVNNRDRE